jgi:chromosome segregation ATPase
MDINTTRNEAEKERESLIARLKQIEEDRDKLKEEEAQVTRRLLGLEQIVEGLELMEADSSTVLEPIGLTDRIRKILSETPRPLYPTQIRDALIAQGVSGSSIKILLISVHTTLTRIKNELNEVNVEGKTAYISKTPKIPTLSPVTNPANKPPIGPVRVHVNPILRGGRLNPNRFNR